ncbi:DNA replication/repair protein RecF [Lactobacillus psittaci]|uniref:DNA replication and repair protein RecF n=1 Tax=Lactobacillus psittaci DSM 15354 TaxID=1122152 RepID=A0A0R1S1A4_9LACO|nr:DNA replication/repair protein RecF [Lactobacillus psittaci]KRL62957.1 recombination protein F [Lactobacillus psittaci DSM 15354]
MYLKQLTLKDYRNFEELATNFSKHVNIFIGQNAQGKTNLLEAIYFLALTRSHRTSSDKELIRFGQASASLAGHVVKSQVETDLKLLVNKKGKKAWINRIQQARLSRYIGQLNAILFSPEDLALVKGAPTIRRRFMDLEFGQINPEYLYFSSQYKQVLQQKNNYLKQLAKGKSQDKVFLEVLSDQLAGLAAEIIARRLKYLHDLSEFAAEAYQAISQGKEQLEVVYNPSVEIKATAVEEIYQQVLASFQKNQASEIRTGTTLSGPHRDDLQFLLNQQDAHFYASQGQQRTIALSLKLAEIQLIHKITGEYPVLLLDDVMSELDHTRQSALLNYIHGKTQTFITTTDLAGISWEIVKAPKIFILNKGVISEGKVK